MAIAQRPSEYAVEVDALMQILVSVARDAKAKKAPLTIAGDALPQVISALDGIAQLQVELAANRAVVETTVLQGLVQLVNAATGA